MNYTGSTVPMYVQHDKYSESADLGKVGSWLKKGSSFANWDNFLQKSNNNSDNFSDEEMRKLLIEKIQQIDVSQVSNKYDLLEHYFLSFVRNKYKDPGQFHHAKTVLKEIKKICLNEFGHERYLSHLDRPSFISSVLDYLSQTGSFQRRKTLLKYFYKLYSENLNVFNPQKATILRLIDLYSMKPQIKEVSLKCQVHPMIEEFLAYLTEKNQRWQKRARVELTVFLKWVAENDELEDYSHLEINIKRISEKQVLLFRKHLEKRIYNGEITKESAQTYIQTIRKWFEFIKLKGYIFRNPCLRLRNFKVTRNLDFDLLSMNDVHKFFTSIIEHSVDPLMDFSLFICFASLGVRANELLQTTMADIDLTKGQIKITRKFGKEQVLPLPGVTWLVLELLFKSLNENTQDQPIWSNRIGTRLKYGSVLNLFHKYREKAGLDENGRATHLFRYLLFSEMCMNEVELDKIKDLAGHEKIKHLNPYIQARSSETKRGFLLNYKTVGGDLYE